MQETLRDRADYLLQEWVNLNSHPANRKGVKEMLELVAEQAKSIELGCETIAHETSPDSNSALRITLESASPALPLVTLVTRVDTEFAEDSPFQLITWVGGRKRAIGPGVLDNKSGILVGLIALEKLMRLENRRFRVQLIVLPGDEGFNEALREASKRSTVILGLNPALQDGGICQARRGWRKILLKSQDTFPFASIAKLSNPDRGMTVTSFQEDDYVQIDLRFDTAELLDQLQEQILPLLEGSDWSVVRDYPPLLAQPESQAASKIALKLIEHHEKKKLSSVKSNEASLSNLLARPGIVILDGLGPVGTGARSQQETVDMSSIFTRADIVADLIQNLIS